MLYAIVVVLYCKLNPKKNPGADLQACSSADLVIQALTVADFSCGFSFTTLGGSLRKLGVPYFGVLLIRILLFRVLY